MNRISKLVYIIGFSFFAFTLFIGYAALTDEVNLIGNIKGSVQPNVFISDVTDVEGNVTLNGFYSSILKQNIKLEENSDATYYVNLYNSNNSSKFIFDGYACANVPEGVEIIIEEVISGNLESNCISSLIDTKGQDIFKVTYKNTTSESKTIETPIQFKYTELTTQIKLELNYNGNKYIEYANVGETAEFNQINIDLTDDTKNVVARCNRAGILGVINDTENNKNYLTVDVVKNYANVGVGELGISVSLFNSLTSAVNNNEDVFKNDTSPNNFIVLQNIGDGIESTSKSMEVLDNRSYSINLNSKEVIIHKPIINKNYLKVYDSNNEKGTLKVVNEDVDILHNVFSTSYLEVYNVKLRQTTYSKTASDSETERNALVVAYEGIVEIKNCDLNSDYGYGIYKLSYYAGKKFRPKTSENSKVLLESSVLTSDYNNAIRLADGAGYVSIVDSYVSSTEHLDMNSKEQKDSIYVSRHRLEEADVDFDIYYRYSVANLKVYMTGGTLKLNNPWNVNHFYSDHDLNARFFYTNSVSFESVKYVAERTGIRARTRNDLYGFNYPIAMLNAPSLTRSDLVNSDGTLKNHYLNKDGWYYIYKTVATQESVTNDTYATLDYIQNAKYEKLTHFDEYIKVGDSLELMNANNPGELYVDTKNLSGKSSLNIPLSDIKKPQTQGDYTGLEYEFTLLASADQYYFNIVSLGDMYSVFQIDSSGDSPRDYTKGVQYISTKSGSNTLDIKEQRFILMEYDNSKVPEPEEGIYSFVFVSQYESVLSFLRTANSYNSSTGKWETTDKYADTHWENKEYISSSLIDSSAPYQYDFEQYLVSNPNNYGYARNGWFLWQEDFPEYSPLYTLNNSLTVNADNKLDSNTTVFLSKYCTTDSTGVYLNANELTATESDNWGYIRISSAKNFIGIEFEIENVEIPNGDGYYTKSITPYLQVRTYSLVDGAYVRRDYEISETNLPSGVYRPSGDKTDYDENNVVGAPYFVIIDQTRATIRVRIIFDAKYENWNLHRVTLDPFNDAAKDNTMLIKNIKLIYPPGP